MVHLLFHLPNPVKWNGVAKLSGPVSLCDMCDIPSFIHCPFYHHLILSRLLVGTTHMKEDMKHKTGYQSQDAQDKSSAYLNLYLWIVGVNRST